MKNKLVLKKKKSLKLKRRKKKTFIPYEFAHKSPEPCLVHKTSPTSKETNRLIKEEEKTIHHLVSSFEYLNTHALRLLADLMWVQYYKTVSSNIDRVPQTSPWFGKHYYKVRFCEYHGTKVVPVFLITKEDDSERYVILGISNEACRKCGKIDCLFKLKPNSEKIRCAGCRGLPGVRNGL